MKNNDALIYLVLAVVIGCGSPSATNTPSTEVETQQTVAVDDTTASPTAETEGPSVRLTLASLEDVQQAIAKAGKPVVVDFWSTACIPCMQEFHGLVELHREHSDDLVCLSVCIDYIGIKSKPPESYRADVEKFLQAQQATLTNYLSTTSDSDIYEKLALESIPAVFVYGKDGSIAKKFVDAGEGTAFTYDKDVKPYVKELLQAPSAQ